MAITDWPEAERPRERLLAHGAAGLSDAELLAIFLRVGVRGKSAVDLARQLIAHFGSLNRLFAADRNEFSAIPGMGAAKFAQLQAVLEMARRALAETMKERDSFLSPATVRDYLRLHLAGLSHEVFFALWLALPTDLQAAGGAWNGESLRFPETLWSAPALCSAVRPSTSPRCARTSPRPAAPRPPPWPF